MLPDIRFLVFAYVCHVRQDFGTSTWFRTVILRLTDKPFSAPFNKGNLWFSDAFQKVQKKTQESN